jgi:hypothetical protein
MDYDSDLVRFFILAPILPAAATLYVLFRKNLQKDSPWFIAYMVVVVLSAPVLFLVYQHGSQWNYFYTSTGYDVISIFIAFMVIFDVFRNAIAEYDAIRRTGTIFIAIVGIALLALALGAGFLPTNAYPEIKSILTMERSVRIVQVGLILAIFGFSSFLGLSWRHHVFGIALGFGLYAAANLAAVAFVSEKGSTFAYKTYLIDQSAFTCVVLLWTIYAFQAHQRRLANIPDSSRRDLQRWNDALSQLLTR